MTFLSFLTPELKEKIRITLGLDSRVSILKKILPKNGFGAELGVFKGEFSDHILRYNKPRKLLLVDVWWTLFGEHYPNWGAYTDFGKLTTRDAHGQVVKIANSFPGTETEIVVGDDCEYLSNLPENTLDWAYIDSSHEYEHTLKELSILERVVKPEGVIAGHDWTEDETNIHYGVSKAVKEFCSQHNYEIFFLDDYSQWAIRQKSISA